MRTVIASVMLLVLVCSSLALGKEMPQKVSNMGNVRGGDVQAAHGIIEKKCTRCHSSKRIDAAIFANKDMQKIQQEMEKKGATLNSSERDVLGIYWKEQNPLKKQK